MYTYPTISSPVDKTDDLLEVSVQSSGQLVQNCIFYRKKNQHEKESTDYKFQSSLGKNNRSQ